jgi:hypothetical protein
MATITGSTSVDWSTVSTDLSRFESAVLLFANRLEQLIVEVDAGRFVLIAPPTPTSISIMFTGLGFAGATATLSGSGFDTGNWMVNAFTYNNPTTPEALRFTGAVGGLDDLDVITSMRITVPGFEDSINGNIVISDVTGAYSGTVTSGVFKFDTDTPTPTTATYKGSLSVSGDLSTFDLTGNITEIHVLRGADTRFT